MSICVISFSSRRNGNCAKISEFICKQLGDVKRFDFCDFEVHPCGGCDYECFEERDKCPWIGDVECELLDAIVNSSLTYFVLPNYCDYPCANFFIFNERSQCYFQKNESLLDAYLRVPKKTVVVSNTNEENFKAALGYHSCDEPQVLFLSAKKYGKRSIDGDIMDSEQAAEELRKFILG